MLSPFRLAGIITVLFAVCGPARAQELAPPGSGVSIKKLIIENGPAHTVKYYVTGGSPRLQSLVRRVEWAENELSVVQQLQRLKLDTVVNERRVAAFRTEQLTNPDYSPGFIPFSVAPDNAGDGASSLQVALKGQLVYQATPDAALRLMGFLERLQTELDAEVKALPLEEQKAIQGPIDALRPRMAVLPGGTQQNARQRDDIRNGIGLNAQPIAPVAAPQVRLSAPPIPQQLSMPQDPVAFQQMVLQNQERVRQQMMQTRQQVMQRHQEVIQRHQMQFAGLRR